MRTTVWPNPSNPEETDEFPECSGNVEENGALVIAQHPGGAVETVYEPAEWASFQTTAAEGDFG